MNFYQYLGVKDNASTEEIRKAFRKMAKVTHPDHNKNDGAFWEMVELNIIKDTLLSHEKRKHYDQSVKNGNLKDLYQAPPGQKNSTIFKSVKNIFIYHCKVCSREMNSTWKGYCLYHYLEATSQLNNDDFIFTYAGQHYRWADPPEDLVRNRKQPKQSPNTSIVLTPLHIGVYISLIISIIMVLILFAVTYI